MDLKTHLDDIEVFHNFILPILNPVLQDAESWSVPDFHWELYANLKKEERLQLLVAPVGFAKSTILKIFALHEILHRKIDNYTIYVSSTDTKAVEHIGAIQKVLKQGYVQAAYGYTVLSSNTHEIVFLYEGQKYKIEAVASGADIAGKNYEGIRPSLIIVDDLEDLEQANSIDRTNKLEDWLFTVLIARLPSLASGRLRMINTVLSLDSLTNRILGNSPNTTPEQLGLFRDWNKYFYQALDENDKSIWEDRHPTKALLEERSMRPSIFARNYMNAPFDQASTLIKNEYLQWYTTIDLNNFDTLFLHADLTHTAKESSDFFCVVIAGKSKVDDNFYIIDFDLRKDLLPAAQIQSIISFFQKYPKIKLGTYDAVSNDWFESQFHVEAKKKSLYLNFKGIKYPKDKISHLNLHLDKYTSKSVFFPKNHPLIYEATNQLLSFPSGKNDDFVDGTNGTLDNFIQKQAVGFRKDVIFEKIN